MSGSFDDVLPRYRWVILSTTMIIRFISFMFYSIAPVLPLIMKEFQIIAVEAGILTSISMLPGLLLPIPAGILAGRYGPKRLGTIALFCQIIGRLIFAFSPHLAIMSAGLFISGVGQQILNVVMLLLIPQWFSSKELGRSLGFNNAAGTGAMFVAMIAVSAISVTYGWRVPFYLGCLMSLVSLLFFFFIIREGPLLNDAQKNDQRNLKETRIALSNPEVWKVGVYWFLVNVTMGSFLTWGPSLFMEFKELSLVYASTITSVSMIMPSIFMPVFGVLSDRLGKRKMFLIIAASSWVILLPLMALSTSVFELILLVVFYGSLAAFMPVCSYALVAEVLDPARAGAGFGILSFCGSMSSVLGSPLTGYVWDITGSLLNTFSFIVIFSIAGAIVAALLKTR